jgi:DNA-binding NtrC family response regulator
MIDNKAFAIITQNQHMRELLKSIDKIAISDFSVLLVGETGVGKEIFAEYVHRMSTRWQKPLIKIGLTALPADLMASELFGHEKGAFTSALNSKKGLFELANEGSLFLDDIDDVPLEIQAKLLRVLESHELIRVGGTNTIPINVRLICASKVDLKSLVDRKLFRADLFYRINVMPIEILPLRLRRDDIPILMEHFFRKFNADKKLKISNEALEALMCYDWPGNVRELRNITQRLSLIAEPGIELQDLPREIVPNNFIQARTAACTHCFRTEHMPYKDVMHCIENQLFDDALRLAEGNQSEASRILGLSLSTFRDKLKKLTETPANCSIETQ